MCVCALKQIKFHEALVPLVPVFANPVMFLLLFEQSVNMHVCSSREKKLKKKQMELETCRRVGMGENGAGYVL